MQESLHKLAVSRSDVFRCAGIVAGAVLYSLGLNLFVVPAGHTGRTYWFLLQVRQ